MKLKRLACVGLLTGAFIYVPCASSQTCSSGQSANSRVFASERQQAIAVKGDTVLVDIQPEPYPFQMKITPKGTSKGAAAVRLPEEIAQIDQICLWKGRIVVRGMVNNALGEVAIFDESGTLVDSFRAYWPNISEKSGLIIFTKDYPIHFAYGTEDHYLVYKLDAAIEANHAPGVGAIQSRPAGIPIYPLSVGNQNFDNVELKGSVHEQMSAGFFWNSKGEEATTLDSFNGKFSLILIQFGKDSASVRSTNVDPQSVCETKPTAVCPTMLYLSRASFVTDKDGNNSIVATFGRPQDSGFFEKVFPVSGFSVEGRRSLDSPQWHPNP